IENPWGVRQLYIGSPSRNNGPSAYLSEVDTVRTAVGIAGDFEDAAEDTIAETWEWEIYGTWGRSRFHGRVPDPLTRPLQDALNSCSDPSDLSNCFNPY